MAGDVMSDYAVASCLVEATSKAADGSIITTSSSGTWLDTSKGLLVTHSTLLIPHVSLSTYMRKAVLSDQIQPKHLYGVQCCTIRTCDNGKKTGFIQSVTDGKELSSINANGYIQRTQAGETISPADIISIWKHKQFAQILKQLFASEDWTFDAQVSKQEDTQYDARLLKQLLPYFIFLKIRNTSFDSINTIKISSCNIQMGKEIYIVSCPFGALCPNIFMNSVSKGIVSNLRGNRQELLLTDARCLPGSEGAPILTDTSRGLELVAVVVAPMCWKAGEWVGLTLACTLGSLLVSLSHELEQVAHKYDWKLTPAAVLQRESTPDMVIKSGLKRTCLVQCTDSWGSGIVVDFNKGYILTCKHVVKAAKYVEIYLHNISVLAKVVFVTNSQSHWDLAMLCADLTMVDTVPGGSTMQIGKCYPGDLVYLLGHGLFGKEHMQPIVTSGVVATVVSHLGERVLIQSTCAVVAGASGGPLMLANGRVGGLVCCNAKDTKTKANYPHVSMSIPLQSVWPILTQFMKTQDTNILQALNMENKTVQDIWALKSNKLRSCNSGSITKARL